MLRRAAMQKPAAGRANSLLWHKTSKREKQCQTFGLDSRGLFVLPLPSPARREGQGT